MSAVMEEVHERAREQEQIGQCAEDVSRVLGDEEEGRHGQKG
jgi:hypothetical protein